MTDRNKIEAAINVLPTKVQSSHPRFEKNMREMAHLIAEIRNQEQQIAEGGGAKAIEAQHKKQRLTARERIALLLDPGTELFELGCYAAWECTRSGAELRRRGWSRGWDASTDGCSC